MRAGRPKPARASRVALLALVVAPGLRSVDAQAQPTVWQLGPEQSFPSLVDPFQIDVAANPDGFAAAWVLQEKLWFREIDSRGEAGPPIDLGSSGILDGHIAWTGESWLVAARERASLPVHPGLLLLSVHERELTARHTVTISASTLALVAGEESALALVSTVDGVFAVHLSADGTPGVPVAIDEIAAHVSPLLTWDGTRFVVAWSTAEGMSIAWIRDEPDAGIEQLASAVFTGGAVRAGCLGSDGAGTVAIAGEGGGGLEVVLLDAAGSPPLPEALLVAEGWNVGACRIDPDPGGLLVFWSNGRCRAGESPSCDFAGQRLDPQGRLVGPVIELGQASDWKFVAAGHDDRHLLVSADGRGTLATDGQVGARHWFDVSVDPEPTGMHLLPSVAWDGHEFLATWFQMDDRGRSHRGARFDATGRILLGAPFDLGVGVAASCDRLACSSAGVCVLACLEFGGGQGGPGGGPALAWLQDDRLAGRVRAADGTRITDLEWGGDRFALVTAGHPARLQYALPAVQAIHQAHELPRDGADCSLLVDEQGALVGCVAWAGAPGWLVRVDRTGVSGEVHELPPLASIELGRSGGTPFVAWTEEGDESRALRVAPLGCDGEPQLDRAVTGAPSLGAAATTSGEGAALLTESADIPTELSVAALAGVEPGALEPVAAPVSPPSSRPFGSKSFDVAWGDGALALAYLTADSQIRVRVAAGGLAGLGQSCADSGECASGCCEGSACADARVCGAADCRNASTTTDAGVPDAASVLAEGSTGGCGCSAAGCVVDPAGWPVVLPGFAVWLSCRRVARSRRRRGNLSAAK